MPRIDIVRNDDGSVGFDPPELTLSVGDAVFFRNMDKQAAHWVAPSGAVDNLWFPNPLGANTGKRPRTSRLLVFVGGGPGPHIINYRCASHGGEVGTITLNQPGSQP